MNHVERDDFASALKGVLKFYNKELERETFSFWYAALGSRPLYDVKKALAHYITVGKFAPKPVDILELMEANKVNEKAHLPPPPAPTTDCPPEIAKAWMWFINRIAEGSQMEGLFSKSKTDDIELHERYLHIVNHEAKLYNQPEAIPDEYKLSEVWG